MVQEMLLEFENQVQDAAFRHWGEIGEAQWQITSLGEVAQKLRYWGALWPRATLIHRNSSVGVSTVMAGGLEGVFDELLEVKQKTQSLWEMVYGSDAVKGERVVLCGLAQASLNSMQGTVSAWDDE